MRGVGGRIWRIAGTSPRILGIVLLAVASAFAATPQFPPLAGRVVDQAGILSPATRGQLDGMLAAHELATGDQVVVVTLKSLQGYSIEEFGYQLGRYWGIGQKGKNNGLLLIVAPSEHKVRIEVGYGLEGKLTDAASRVIIDHDILPAFRHGDFNAGVLAGVGSILRVLGGEEVSGGESGIQWDDSTPGPMPVDAVVLMLCSGVLFLILVFGERLVSRRLDRLTYGTRRGSHHDSFFALPPPRFFGGGYRSGGFGGGGHSGGGSGGFSGGGGSFGGGGASGSW